MRGGYEPIARVFRRSRYERFLLEYDDSRSGGFEPLAVIPDARTVVLGFMTTKTARLESVDELRRRVLEATRFIPFERLALIPQCSFASTMEGNRLTADDQWAKLRRVAETARRLWNP
jgi:5-methyltetrahydropteroyltriglutamate--homocysteine methyltransferase